MARKGSMLIEVKHPAAVSALLCKALGITVGGNVKGILVEGTTIEALPDGSAIATLPIRLILDVAEADDLRKLMVGS